MLHFLSVLAFERRELLVYFSFGPFQFAAMENDAGESVDLYRPRKW
jgi:hypothetical protein